MEIPKNREIAPIIKASSIGILGGLFSFLVFHFFNRFLVSFDFSFLWFVLGFLLLFLITFALQTFFIRDSVLLFGMTFIQGLLPLAVFSPYFKSDNFFNFLGVAVILLLIFFITASKSGLDSLENSLEIKFFSISHKVVLKAFVGLLIAILIFSYFYMFHLDNFGEERGRIVFDKSLVLFGSGFHIWFPSVDFDMNLKNALDRMASVQIERSKLDFLKQGIQFDKLPLFRQKEMIKEARTQIKSGLENLTGISVNPEERFDDYIYRSVRDRLDGLSSGIQFLLKSGSLILFFFLIKGLSFLIYIPVEFLSFLIFKLMVQLGFGKITIRGVNKEDIAI